VFVCQALCWTVCKCCTSPVIGALVLAPRTRHLANSDLDVALEAVVHASTANGAADASIPVDISPGFPLRQTHECSQDPDTFKTTYKHHLHSVFYWSCCH
jgi:hypothetical protein